MHTSVPELSTLSEGGRGNFSGGGSRVTAPDVYDGGAGGGRRGLGVNDRVETLHGSYGYLKKIMIMRMNNILLEVSRENYYDKRECHQDNRSV